MISMTMRGIASALCLAATPVFAVMALLTAGGPMEAICGHDSLFAGMAPMYALMAAVHAAPWLRLLAR